MRSKARRKSAKRRLSAFAQLFSPQMTPIRFAGLAFKWERYRREAALEGRHLDSVCLPRDARRQGKHGVFFKHGLRNLMAHVVIVVTGPLH